MEKGRLKSTEMGERLDFSNLNRARFLSQLEANTFDLLVIGGGITGAGIALDAAARGLSVALIEKDDFASGTSGKSTKLIHGGLRYLKQFEFGLVKEVGQERAVLHNLAPHLVVPEKMLLPLIEGGSMGRIMTSIGLYIYDFLADVESDDKRKMLDKEETLDIEPLLPEDRLLGGSLYAEYRTDDARLTIEVIKTAYLHGALPVNYVRGNEAIEKDGKIIGVKCTDQLTGKELYIKAEIVVNATGPWVDDIRSWNGPIKGKRLYLTKGVHLVVPHAKLPVRQAIYFDVPRDKRMIFCIPRLSVTYIGTTDTYYEGDKDSIEVSEGDADYLLTAVNRTFPSVELETKDVLSSWAGIRPLIYEDGKSASEISRKDEIFTAPNGLVSIAGGKLTGYRKMAERVVDLVVEKLGTKSDSCKTREIPLTPDPLGNTEKVNQFRDKLASWVEAKHLPPIYVDYLLQNYGTNAEHILNEVSPNSIPAKQLLRAELQYCITNEMVATVADFLIRRTGRLYFLPETIAEGEVDVFHHLQTTWPGSPEFIALVREEWTQTMA